MKIVGCMLLVMVCAIIVLLTPDMEITVTTQSYTSDPFYNGAKEIQEQYMRMYQFDYKKSNCSKYDFEFMKIG